MRIAQIALLIDLTKKLIHKKYGSWQKSVNQNK